ncbi:pantothenate synthetase [Idiomarina fontislapidosi]|uniref:Pantothenate synthetase n=1 Tax=Idiomarina fontislapidosi TaxID=263723 RepID=A0A432Y870_9GAMM|nr:pantoate--beta-alanine ligase [Idiomarina fontislapidosi]PYE33733.1 pantothenate synthetase [Idiomarina fontislapidosi]RUO57132.1 pantoate--beta-alanine ligase [Idiomarina fontislapidosi]
MLVLKNLKSMRQWRSEQTSSVALVPTMGNLHEGHLSLVRKAQTLAEKVVVSIFVNPMQFGAGEDLDNYPRTLEQDCRLLSEVGAHAVFTPTVQEVYPRGLEQQTRVEVPDISDILCGASRPGHFTGVATIVCKLFNMAQPNIAVFGEKDFQQLQVIRLMASDLSLPVKVVGAAIQREPSGLAMSSRNGYLSDAQRHQASHIYQQLCWVKQQLRDATQVSSLCQQASQQLEQQGFNVDYFEVRNAHDLTPASSDASEWVILAAAKLGNTRLIDNLRVPNQA